MCIYDIHHYNPCVPSLYSLSLNFGTVFGIPSANMGGTTANTWFTLWPIVYSGTWQISMNAYDSTANNFYSAVWIYPAESAGASSFPLTDKCGTGITSVSYIIQASSPVSLSIQNDGYGNIQAFCSGSADIANLYFYAIRLC